MDSRLPLQLGAIVFVAGALTVTAIELARRDDAPALPPAHIARPARDPLREEQRRCQELGQKAAEDAVCLRVWAETRARFLGRAPTSPTSGEGR